MTRISLYGNIKVTILDYNLKKERKSSLTAQIIMNTSAPYSILEIDQDATPKVIKKAYRRLAKKYHPDKNPGHEEDVREKFKEITVAYKNLINSSRAKNSTSGHEDEFDKSKDTKRSESYNVYRINIKNPRYEKHVRYKEIRRKCRLILSKLLSQKFHRAIEIYEYLKVEVSDFDLFSYLDYMDSRDCEFLLAEAYQMVGDYTKAIILYELTLEHERKQTHFKQFTEEIRIRLKKIYFNVFKNGETEEMIDCIPKILDLGLSKKRLAWIYKKVAESYFEDNLLRNARETLKKAFIIYPNLKGTKKICRKVGMEDYQ